MKTTFLGVLLSLFSLSASAEIEQDKMLHFGVSSVIGFGTNYVVSDWRKSFGICVTIGAAKEIYDEDDYGHGSMEDIGYDIAGCIVGIAASETLGMKMALIPEPNLDGVMLAVQYDF